MSCEFEARVSLLLDDALAASEAAAVRRHITECESCRILEQDFAHLGRAIRSFDPVAETPADAALDAVLSSRRVAFWARRVSIPLPLAAAATLAIAALGAWAAYGEIGSQQRAQRMTESLKTSPQPIESAGLDRFDRGQRALLYKVRRADL